MAFVVSVVLLLLLALVVVVMDCRYIAHSQIATTPNCVLPACLTHRPVRLITRFSGVHCKLDSRCGQHIDRPFFALQPPNIGGYTQMLY